MTVLGVHPFRGHEELLFQALASRSQLRTVEEDGVGGRGHSVQQCQICPGEPVELPPPPSRADGDEVGPQPGGDQGELARNQLAGGEPVVELTERVVDHIAEGMGPPRSPNRFSGHERGHRWEALVMPQQQPIGFDGFGYGCHRFSDLHPPILATVEPVWVTSGRVDRVMG